MGKNTAQQIQKNAIALFREHGYSKVTILDICHETGISKSTFYYHYPSKDNLLTDFYKYTINIPQETMRLLATSDNCWEKLWACLEPSIKWTNEAGVYLLSQVFISNIRNKVDSFTMSDNIELQNLYIGIIRKGQETSQFRNTSDPVELYNCFRHIILGIAVEWCIKNGDFDEKKRILESVAAMLQVREDLID